MPATSRKKSPIKSSIAIDTLIKAWELMCQARAMSALYEEKSKLTSKYVHATSKGHEAIQLALGMQLLPQDFVAPYYRDDSILLGLGMRPYELMLQLLAKADDPFSNGRSYYSHPSLNDPDKPKIPHQSSATGMQAIPLTGVALGMRYKEEAGIAEALEHKPVAVCSLGDASITEGEVSEAFQMAVLKQLPVIFLIQDNEWDISAKAEEIRAQDATHFAQGFKGLKVKTIDGTDFVESFSTVQEVLNDVRKNRGPWLIHAKVPLLNHHTSGVRMEFYRSEKDLAEHRKRDPFPKFRKRLIELGLKASELEKIEKASTELVELDFEKALQQPDPEPSSLLDHIFAPTPITEETGEREPADKEATVMVDCALFAIRELMQDHPECLLYGQDVGARLGGVFREAATLAKEFGDHRVYNTPIQEAFIVGSTVGMSAVGLKPIVEVQFADYIWPGLNQLYTEVSRSNYLSGGQWPVSNILRVPIGAYGSGGPYHSSSVESVVLNIKGLKVAYPSTGADLKGLMKSAYYDPNPVVMFEHKGLYWSKIKGTEDARSIEPSADYVIPFGKGRMVMNADQKQVENGEALVIVCYGMGVYWAKGAAKDYPGRVSILDLRTLAPYDKELVYEQVQAHGRCIVLTEETISNSFAEALSGRIAQDCFEYLDAPVRTIGSIDTPAIPINSVMEATMLPNATKVSSVVGELLAY